MLVHKAYKFKLLPNETQKSLLNKTFGCVRFAWNQWVEAFNNKSKHKTTKELRNQFEWMKAVSANVVDCCSMNFKSTIKQYFSKTRKTKIGRPQFKKKGVKDSYQLTNQRYYIKDNRIQIEKIGKVKFIQDRTIPSHVKYCSATVSKDHVGDYWISISVEEVIHPKTKTGEMIGLDVGIKHYLTLSDGTKVDNPKHFIKNQDKITRLQKHQSRKIKCSTRYNKLKKKIAKQHRKVERQRDHFLHTLTTWFVSTFDFISIEDLNVEQLKQKMGKYVSDASWSKFFNLLSYKCEWYGKELVKIGRYEPSSKTCSVCGSVHQGLVLSDRVWTCTACNTQHDRDINAAVNILAMGINVALRTQSDCIINHVEASCSLLRA